MPRDIPVTRLRNIGIMAHIDAGKTTCAERILFVTGRIHRTGEVHHGNTVMDFDPISKKRGITIGAAATRVSWDGHRIQIVDTPGHVDFTIEVERSLRVLDGAVFVLDGASGVECQSETVFRQAEKHEVPSLAFVNKLDKVGSSFEQCLVEIRERLGITPAPVHFPIGEGTSDLAIVDVVRQKLVRFVDAKRTTEEDYDASKERGALAELAAEFDEEVFSSWAKGESITDAALQRALRKGTLARKIMVVTCGSALKNVGIPTLLDAVIAYLPSPLDRNSDARDDAPLAALAFKTIAERSGHLAYVRIYSGTLHAGSKVRVGSRYERVSRVLIPHADAREETSAAHAGDIVMVMGLRDVRTGETICDPDHEVSLESIDVPEPVVEVAIEPKTRDDRERLPSALARMLFEDPSLRSSVDAETGQLKLAGMGMLHLEVRIQQMLELHEVALSVGRPEVAWRETIAKPARVSYRHVKQSGGPGQFACVTIEISPAPRGSGISFESTLTGGAIPREWIPSVEKGARDAAARGPFAGHPMTDVHVGLLDGETHPKDSSALAFEIAGARAFEEACRAAGCLILEPQCEIEVTVPEEHTGTVTGDLGARRGTIERITARGSLRTIVARLPFAETFDYVPRLRGLTQGRGTAIARPGGYAVAPTQVAAKVLA